ncbi:BTAD domain-containing putative transcriptional regulator [Streptomyces sp. NPDC050703]|uniref:AfsR/SARP family transcriptional regulator n=1 Tax=Streptomyces sp. NPDC050703 TaxID=3157218 RepID=UPI003420F540
MRVTHEGTGIEIPGAKPRTIIASLALHPGEVISSADLLDELWGDNPPRSAGNSLQGHVARLRRSLAEQTDSTRARDLLRTSGSGYLLDVDADDVDALRFTRIVQQVGSRTLHEDPERAITVLNDALRLWRGPALADTGQGISCQTACAHLNETKLMAKDLLIEAQLALGLHREVVPQLKQLLTRHPLRERFCEQLMLALYRSGRQADAINVYYRVREHLSNDLGLEPGPGMRSRLAEILKQEPSLILAGR